MYSYYGPKTVPGTFGIALLSRYPIRNPRTFYLYSYESQNGMLVDLEQTAAIEVEVVVGDRVFDVFVTHLGNDGPVVQQREVLPEVDGKENAIFLGDFNFDPDSEQYSLTTVLLDDTWAVRLPGVDKRGVDFTGEGIDHIFVTPGTRVVDAQYWPEPESDHPAVTADIEW
jgi:endonuclease/exonuclease/phosphatase family metal-dependent hydrolase